jgi:hypothetical protein
MYTIGRRRWPALFLLLLLLLRPAAARAAVELWPSVVVSSTLKYSERASLGSDPVYASRAAAVFHTSTHSKQRHTRRAADIIIAGGAPRLASSRAAAAGRCCCSGRWLLAQPCMGRGNQPKFTFF